MPILNIKDPEVHALAAELARRHGKSMTQVVKEALSEQLAREKSMNVDSGRLVERVMEIGRRISSRPVIDSRPAEEILGYDERGLPRSW
jgi:antitoxin VapB